MNRPHRLLRGITVASGFVGPMPVIELDLHPYEGSEGTDPLVFLVDAGVARQVARMLHALLWAMPADTGDEER